MNDIRVRFAPSPSGFMHLGSVRTALINYIFAQQKKGTFILRIEDTDPERNFDPNGTKIMQDLKWLGLTYQEGPPANGQFGPYYQSQRTNVYKNSLSILEEKGSIYRCFCTEEELEKKRKRQITLKQPPRYDRTCFLLTPKEIEFNLSNQQPFIWRFKIDENEKITISDLARGSVTFDLKNFSDFPLTRKNGSFTFLFANCIDDIEMRISHVFRGEDHLSNTANQAALYTTLEADLPTFWHMPILCNSEGKKLSKRDFGFSLQDLKDAGFLPEAILNYVAIIGGSFEQEIMSLDEMSNAIDFENLTPSGQIKYDVQKLMWVNHHWILRTPLEQLVLLCKPYLIKEFNEAKKLTDNQMIELISVIKDDLYTLADCPAHAAFYFRPPINACDIIQETFTSENLQNIAKILRIIKEEDSAENYVHELKMTAKQFNIRSKELFSFLRIALTGSASGPSMVDIISLLGLEETDKRINAIIEKC